MPITDKTRKILWGRSGNRCAICRRELLVDKTDLNSESVVGDECHIVSEKPMGPRSNSLFPAEGIDDPENLVLLCRVHHKMVDDQCQTYDAELLRSIKEKHERWVSSTLTNEPKPVRIRRIKGNVPSHLIRLTSGSQIIDIVCGAAAFSFRHDDLQTEEETDLVSGFLQNAQDWGEILPELEIGERVRAAFQMNTALRELEAAGFFVFGATEQQRLEGGVGPPTGFLMGILHVLRTTNPSIIKVTIPKDSDEQEAGTTGDRTDAARGKV